MDKMKTNNKYKVELSPNDSNARQPSELGYMKLLRLLLRMISSWPPCKPGERMCPHPLRDTRWLFFEWIIVLITGIIYVKRNVNVVSFFELGQSYLTVFLNIVGCQRITISWFKAYRDTMVEFFEEMHLFHHRHKSEYSEYMFRYINKICSVFVTFIYVEIFFGIFLFNLAPFINNYTKGMFSKDGPPPGKLFEHSLNCQLPYIEQFSTLKWYIPFVFVNIKYSIDCGLCFCGFDVTLAVITFHIWGNLKVLDHSLKSIPTPAEMRDQNSGQDTLFYTKEENKKIAVMLKDIVDHHKVIMRFMTKTSAAFGPMLCLYYMFYQVTGCIMLLLCSKLEAQSLTRYGILTMALFQLLIQISVIIELLGSQSETLKDTVYAIPWECMDTSNRRIAVFLLYNVQEPIRLKPMGIVSVGVQTMATILKTSFSYFMFLRTFT